MSRFLPIEHDVTIDLNQLTLDENGRKELQFGYVDEALDKASSQRRISYLLNEYNQKLQKVENQRKQRLHRRSCTTQGICQCPVSIGLDPVQTPLFSSGPTCTNYLGPVVTGPIEPDVELTASAPLIPRAGRIKHKSRSAEVKRFYQEQAIQKVKQQQIRPKDEVAMGDKDEDGTVIGKMRYQKVLETLLKMGYEPSPDQQKFFDAFAKACLPIIYGKKNWDGNSMAVLDELMIQRIQYEVLIQTARRMGKTVSIAMFVTAMLYCCPGVKLCVFSTGQRASGSLMDLVIGFLCKLEGGERRIISQNQEQLFVALEELPEGVSGRSTQGKKLRTEDTTSKLFSYPSTVTGKCLLIYKIHIHMHAMHRSASLSPLLLEPVSLFIHTLLVFLDSSIPVTM